MPPNYTPKYKGQLCLLASKQYGEPANKERAETTQADLGKLNVVPKAVVCGSASDTFLPEPGQGRSHPPANLPSPSLASLVPSSQVQLRCQD